MHHFRLNVLFFRIVAIYHVILWGLTYAIASECNSKKDTSICLPWKFTSLNVLSFSRKHAHPHTSTILNEYGKRTLIFSFIFACRAVNRKFQLNTLIKWFIIWMRGVLSRLWCYYTWTVYIESKVERKFFTSNNRAHE